MAAIVPSDVADRQTEPTEEPNVVVSLQTEEDAKHEVSSPQKEEAPFDSTEKKEGNSAIMEESKEDFPPLLDDTHANKTTRQMSQFQNIATKVDPKLDLSRTKTMLRDNKLHFNDIVDTPNLLLKKLHKSNIRHENGNSDKLSFHEFDAVSRGAEIWYILRESGRFRRVWDLIIVLLILFNAYSIPVDVAFGSKSDGALNTIVDILFFVDIVVNFLTAR
jgi:hypothetical protein